MTWQRIVFLPDFQIPSHDQRFVNNLVRFVREYSPDGLYLVGDFLDSPEPSRWSKGMAGEYAPTLQRSINQAIGVLQEFRYAYDGPFSLKMGNHDERIETYVARYAPALASLDGLKFETLLETDSLDIDVIRGLKDVAPGWVLAHGHEGPYRSIGGMTAKILAERIGRSVVCGHTHKVALVPGGPHGYNGNVPPALWGMEVGHAMDVRKATYLPAGSAGWQKGLGILYVSNRRVIPVPITANADGSFLVEGAIYG